MCRPRRAPSWKCCAPTHRRFSPTPRRGAAGTKNGSRCRPHAWTCATCPSRCGHAPTAAPRNKHPGGSAVRRRRLGRPRHRAFLSLLARVLDHLLALGGVRSAPLLAQQLAPRRRQLLEPVKILPHVRLLVRGQCLEFLPAVAQRMALLGGGRLPAPDALARLIALLGRHPEPALGAARERLLARGRQAVPLASEARQQLLLLRRKTRPGNRGRGIRAGSGRLLRKRGRCREQQQGEDARTPSVTHYFLLRMRSAAAGAVLRAPRGPWPQPARRATDRFAPGSPGSPRPGGRRFPGTRESQDRGPRAAACACRRCEPGRRRAPIRAAPR